MERELDIGEHRIGREGKLECDVRIRRQRECLTAMDQMSRHSLYISGV
jgi:hypothetical protein